MFDIELRTESWRRAAVGIAIAVVTIFGLMVSPQAATAQDLPPLEAPIEVPPSVPPTVSPGEPPAEPPPVFADLTADEATACLNQQRARLLALHTKLNATFADGVLDRGSPNLSRALASGGAPGGEILALVRSIRGPLQTTPVITDNLFRPETANAQSRWATAAHNEAAAIADRLRTYGHELDRRMRASTDPAEQKRLAAESKLLWDTWVDVDDMASAARAYGGCRTQLEAVRDNDGDGGGGQDGANLQKFDDVQRNLQFWVESREALNAHIASTYTETTRLRRAESGYSQLALNYEGRWPQYAEMFRERADEAATSITQVETARNRIIQLAESMGARTTAGGVGPELLIGAERLAALERLGSLPLDGAPSDPGDFATAPDPWVASSALPTTRVTAAQARMIVGNWLRTQTDHDSIEVQVAQVLQRRVSQPGVGHVDLTFTGSDDVAPRDEVTEALTHVLWWTSSRTFEPKFNNADSLNTALALIEQMSDPTLTMPSGGLLVGTASQPPLLASSPAKDVTACVDIPLARVRVSGRTVTFEFDRLAGGFRDDAQVVVSMIDQQTGEWHSTNPTSGDSVSWRLAPETRYSYSVGTQCNDGPFASQANASRGHFVTL